MIAVSAPWLPKTYAKRHSHSASTRGRHQRYPLTRRRRVLTVGMCLARSRTRRRASRRRAAQRAAGNSGSGLSPAGSTSALGTDYAVHSTWAYCQIGMIVNHHGSWWHIAEEQHAYFSVSCGCGMFEYPPSSNLCTWSKFAMRCAAVRSRSTSTSASQKSARLRILSVEHKITDEDMCSPFCFTFSKGTTRSDKRLGNPLRCVVCCCCGCCCNTDGGRCVSSLTPGGN